MPAGEHKFYCEQGATFLRTITVLGLDLTGHTVRGAVRKSGAVAKLIDLTCVLGACSAVSSVFTVGLTAVQTAGIEVGSVKSFRDTTTHFYDIEIVKPDSTVMRMLNGDFEVSPEASK